MPDQSVYRRCKTQPASRSRRERSMGPDCFRLAGSAGRVPLGRKTALRSCAAHTTRKWRRRGLGRSGPLCLSRRSSAQGWSGSSHRQYPHQPHVPKSILIFATVGRISHKKHKGHKGVDPPLCPLCLLWHVYCCFVVRIYSDTFFASTSSGTFPPSTTASSNAFTSNF